MKNDHILYLGVKSSVVAIDKISGDILWRKNLGDSMGMGDQYVTLLVEENFIYAHSGGEIYCIESLKGDILWNNPLKGLGYGIASLATNTNQSDTSIPRIREIEKDKTNG